jgi:hypothetical protein
LPPSIPILNIPLPPIFNLPIFGGIFGNAAAQPASANASAAAASSAAAPQLSAQAVDASISSGLALQNEVSNVEDTDIVSLPATESKAKALRRKASR